jgi:hypothetical protein
MSNLIGPRLLHVELVSAIFLLSPWERVKAVRPAGGHRGALTRNRLVDAISTNSCSERSPRKLGMRLFSAAYLPFSYMFQAHVACDNESSNPFLQLIWTTGFCNAKALFCKRDLLSFNLLPHSGLVLRDRNGGQL